MTQPPFPPSGPYGSPSPGAPQGYNSAEEKTWALIAHFGGAVVGFIAPLVVFLAKGSESTTVRAHAVAALNFQIVCSGSLFVISVLRVCTAFLLPSFISLLLSLVVFAIWIGVVVFAIIGGLRANDGQVYSYPIPVSLVK